MFTVDLFSGAGGLSHGLSGLGFEVVLANEIDRQFAASYVANHPGALMLDCDIHIVDFAEQVARLGLQRRIDLLVGGPPCQGFSTVGSKLENDPRNSLFFEYLRAVREIEPRCLIFENVSGFSTLYGGEAAHTLKRSLGELGYDHVGAVLDAADFGLPQYRKRTIVLGWRRGTAPLSLPTPTHGEEGGLFGLRPRVTLMSAIGDLPPLSAGGSADQYLTAPQNPFQAAARAGCPRLTEHNCSNYGPRMRTILELVPPGGCILDLPFELRPKNFFGNTYARLLPDQPAPTITRNLGTPSSSRCIHPFQPRALSTREGARLQGFPDSYLFLGGKQAKNLQVGNAVPPIFGASLGQQILRAAGRRPRIAAVAADHLSAG